MGICRRYPWDQQADESDEEYARFLSYRNLGSARSLDKAYRLYTESVAGPDEVGTRPRKAPGNWKVNSSAHNWINRATSWDCSQVRMAAARIATLWITGVELLAKKGVRGAQLYSPGDRQWPSVLDTFRVLAGHLSEEGVRQLGETTGLSPDPDIPEPDGEPVGELILADDGVS